MDLHVLWMFIDVELRPKSKTIHANCNEAF